MRASHRPSFVILGTLLLAGPVGASAAGCPKPLSAIDRWDDVDINGVYDPGESYDPVTTGWVSPADTGVLILLEVAAPPAALHLNDLFLIDLPPLGSGGSPMVGETVFRQWMSGCAPYDVVAGDSLQLEPGNLHDALIEEANALVALDPAAYWDEPSATVKGSAYAASPRLIFISLFDPTYPPVSGRNSVKTTKTALVFLESVGGGSDLAVRFMTMNPEFTPTRLVSWGRLKRDYRKELRP